MSMPNENGGGGFRFGSDTDNTTGTPPPGSSTSNASDSAEVAKNVVIIFLAGVGIILGLVVIVYVLSVIADRYCCCIPGFQAITGGASHQIDHGPVAHKAGLAGLTLRDRRAILNKLMVGMPYSKEMAQGKENPELEPEGATIPQGDGGGSDIDSEAKTPTKAGDSVEAADAEKVVVTKPTEDTEDEGEQKETVEAGPEETGDDGVSSQAGDKPESNLNDADHNTTCAICLNDYQEGETVLRGKRCQHLFHRSCAMEWLDKHDHCPFCRKEMMTPAEFRDTAVELFGQERVTQLSMWGARAYRDGRNHSTNINSDDEAVDNDADAAESGRSIFRDSISNDNSEPPASSEPAAVAASS